MCGGYGCCTPALLPLLLLQPLLLLLPALQLPPWLPPLQLPQLRRCNCRCYP